MASEIENLVLRIMADAKQLKTELAVADKAVQGFAMKSAVAIKGVGAGMKSLGTTMSMMFTLPIAVGAAGAVASFASMDHAMTQSLAIMGDLSEGTKQAMEDLAISMSETGIQSARELADSYFFLASAGLNAEESMGALPIVQQFATAGMFDMAEATDLLTDAFSALKMNVGSTELQMQNMTALSDQLVAANTMANASVEQFSTALTSKAGSAMAAFNITSEEGIAVLAAMADQGIKAELAGHQLDRMLRLLNQSAMENKLAHEELGFAVFDSAGNMNNLGSIIGQLEGITAGMSDEMKAATLAQLGFEARIQQVILPLLGTSDAIADYEERLGEAGGTTDEVAKKQMKSFMNQMKMLWNQIKNVAAEIGEAMVPALKSMAESIKGMIAWWRGLSEGTQSFILKVTLAVAIIGPLVFIMGALITAAAGAYLIFVKLAAAWGFATVKAMLLAGATKILAAASAIANAALAAAPYIAAAAAIVLVVKAVYDLTANTAMYNEELKRRNKLEGEWKKMKGEAQAKQIEGLEGLEGEDKIKRLNEMINKSTREVSGYRMQVSQSKKVAEELAPTWWSLKQWGKDVHNLAVEDAGLAQDRLDTQIAHQKELKKMLLDEQRKVELAEEQKKLEEERKATGGPVAGNVIAKETAALEDMNAKLKEQQATVGMTASEIEVYRAQVKGANEDQLDTIRVIQEENDAMQEAIDKKKEEQEAEENRQAYFKDTVDAMQEEIDTFGMGATELAKYKAEKEGLSDIEVAMIGVKSKALEKLKEEEKLMKKGEALTKSMRSPAEKFKDGQEELNKMLAAGAIDLDTYTKAMEKLEKDTTVKVKFKVTGIEAVEAGSAEAVARLEEFRALTQDDQKIDFRKEGEAIKANAKAEEEAAIAEAIKLEAIAAMAVTDHGLPPSVDPAAHAAELAGGKPNIMEEWMANNDPFAHLEPKAGPDMGNDGKDNTNNLEEIKIATTAMADRTPVVIEEAAL
jgi:TP901 family phage tail tape measure protein